MNEPKRGDIWVFEYEKEPVYCLILDRKRTDELEAELRIEWSAYIDKWMAEQPFREWYVVVELFPKDKQFLSLGITYFMTDSSRAESLRYTMSAVDVLLVAADRFVHHPLFLEKMRELELI